MAAAVTEALVERMIESTCESADVPELFSMLQHNIDQEDGVILNEERDATTAEVYGSEAQIAVMRRMWQVAQVRPWVREDVEELDAAVVEVESAGPAPLFFRLIVIIYKQWSAKWKDEDDESGSEDGGDDDAFPDDGEDDEDMMMGEVEEVQVPGPGDVHVFPMAGGADMKALLAGLQDVYKGQARGR